jgi:hypothetical protein
VRSRGVGAGGRVAREHGTGGTHAARGKGRLDFLRNPNLLLDTPLPCVGVFPARVAQRPPRLGTLGRTPVDGGDFGHGPAVAQARKRLEGPLACSRRLGGPQALVPRLRLHGPRQAQRVTDHHALVGPRHGGVLAASPGCQATPRPPHTGRGLARRPRPLPHPPAERALALARSTRAALAGPCVGAGRPPCPRGQTSRCATPLPGPTALGQEIARRHRADARPTGPGRTRRGQRTPPRWAVLRPLGTLPPPHVAPGQRPLQALGVGLGPRPCEGHCAWRALATPRPQRPGRTRRGVSGAGPPRRPPPPRPRATHSRPATRPGAVGGCASFGAAGRGGRAPLPAGAPRPGPSTSGPPLGRGPHTRRAPPRREPGRQPGGRTLVRRLAGPLPHGSAGGHVPLDRVAQPLGPGRPGSPRALQGPEGARRRGPPTPPGHARPIGGPSLAPGGGALAVRAALATPRRPRRRRHGDPATPRRAPWPRAALRAAGGAAVGPPRLPAPGALGLRGLSPCRLGGGPRAGQPVA